MACASLTARRFGRMRCVCRVLNGVEIEYRQVTIEEKPVTDDTSTNRDMVRVTGARTRIPRGREPFLNGVRWMWSGFLSFLVLFLSLQLKMFSAGTVS